MYEQSLWPKEKQNLVEIHVPDDLEIITLTHGAFSVTEIDCHMPVHEGRRAQTMPYRKRNPRNMRPTQLVGVHACIDLPLFSTSATVVFGPDNMPPSSHLLEDIIEYQDIYTFYVTPVVIEQWSAESPVSEKAKKLRSILFGGGPLSPRIGN
ncbi:aminoadipate reductase [Apiospora saccharicola]